MSTQEILPVFKAQLHAPSLAAQPHTLRVLALASEFWACFPHQTTRTQELASIARFQPWVPCDGEALL